MSEVKIVSLKPTGYYANGDPMYEFNTSLPSKNVRALGQPKETPEEAFEAGEKFVDEYQRSTYQCGSGTVIGVTELPDGKFDAVVNTYYSFS
jgi:hypothetical protein